MTRVFPSARASDDHRAMTRPKIATVERFFIDCSLLARRDCNDFKHYKTVHLCCSTFVAMRIQPLLFKIVKIVQILTTTRTCKEFQATPCLVMACLPPAGSGIRAPFRRRNKYVEVSAHVCSDI